MEQVTAAAAIIGFINGLKLLENPDKKPFFYFASAIILGILAGYFKVFGLSGIEQGLMVALASSGYYKISQNI